MIILLITILKCLALGWTISQFQPIHWLVDLLKESMLKWTLVLLTQCSKCCSFWVTLSYTGDLFIASVSYILMGMITSLTSNINHLWIKFLNK